MTSPLDEAREYKVQEEFEKVVVNYTKCDEHNIMHKGDKCHRCELCETGFLGEFL